MSKTKTSTITMKVIKRDGNSEPISFDKVKYRIENLCALPNQVRSLQKVNPEKYELNRILAPLTAVDSTIVAQKVIGGIYDGVTTGELDELAMTIAQPMSLKHPEYGVLASRLAISNYHKNTIQHLFTHVSCSMYDNPPSLSDIKNRLFAYSMEAIFNNVDIHGNQTPLIAPHIFYIALQNADKIESMINYSKDYNYDYMGFKVMEGSYLIKANLLDHNRNIHRVLVERPQHMLMRVAIAIHCSGPYTDWNKQLQDYDSIWREITPTLMKRLDANLIEKLKKKMYTNKITWEDIIRTFQTSGPLIMESEDLDILLESVNKYTKTWNELASDYPTELSDETWNNIQETYNQLSDMKMIHATPTLFHAGTLRPQCSSCYLGTVSDDLYGIAHHWKVNAQIAKWAGGQGSHYHNIRSSQSYIRGTNGTSNGLSPLLRVDDAISVYIDQGGNKRPGSHAIYLELWHADIATILRMRDPHEGNEEEKAKHLFYAMWIADEFMRCVEEEQRLSASGTDAKLWYLMDPNQSKFLNNCYDEKYSSSWLSDAEVFESTGPTDYAFTHLYRTYIRQGKYISRVSASQMLWKLIYNMNRKTGQPYMTYKDAANRKSNQKNLGVIQSSNLCAEIIEFSSVYEIAVCNLSSIALNKFVIEHEGMREVNQGSYPTTTWYPDQIQQIITGKVTTFKYFDFEAFMQTVRMCVRNLNKVIDINYYPVPETYRSNMRHRPIGIGIQGQADMLSMLRLPFAGHDAMKLMFHIHEAMYFAALDESCLLSRQYGPYDTFVGSPASRGELQFDLWLTENPNAIQHKLSMPWDDLKNNIIKNGLRNSLLIALMPTGSTSNIMGNSPCFEPHNGLVYNRRNKAGEFILANKYFQQDMLKLGLWNDQVIQKILESRSGGIGDVLTIPKIIRDIYPTVWELRPADPMRYAAITGPFICQSRSMSLFVKELSLATFTKLQFFAWRNGLKTGSYYTRQMAGTDARKVSTSPSSSSIAGTVGPVCTMQDGCLTCGS